MTEENKNLECKRCGYRWTSRKKIVKTCAKCRSPYWDMERKK